MAVPRWRSIFVYLRGWTGALLLPAARLSWYASGTVLRARYSTGIPYREELRAALHGVVRSPGLVHRSLAISANQAGSWDSYRSGTARTNRVAVFALRRRRSLATQGFRDEDLWML